MELQRIRRVAMCAAVGLLLVASACVGPTPAPEPPVRAVALTAGGEQSCAITAVGDVRCWGDNVLRDPGYGPFTRTTPFSIAEFGSTSTTLSAGYRHVCALDVDGVATCAGENENGRLGDGTWTDRTAPVDVVGLGAGVRSIAAGEAHTCAINADTGVVCWGRNHSGQLGDGTTTTRTTPVAVAGLESGVAAIAVGGSTSCALTDAGGVLCWGENFYGQLGDGTTGARSTPGVVSGLETGVTAISRGHLHTCALTDTTVECWGSNGQGQLGDGTTTQRSTPVSVIGTAAGITSIDAGAVHTCAVDAVGAVSCWGYNIEGQLGRGTISANSSTPARVVGLDADVVALAGGTAHSCATSVDGTVRCWGRNQSGQLGNGTIGDPVPSPVRVTGFG